MICDLLFRSATVGSGVKVMLNMVEKFRYSGWDQMPSG